MPGLGVGVSVGTAKIKTNFYIAFLKTFLTIHFFEFFIEQINTVKISWTDQWKECLVG
jgi:hypothetical protein